MKSSKKVQRELSTRKKNGETGTKRALDYFRMPKLKEILTTAATVFHMRDLQFCKMFSPLFCFEQEKTLKNCSKKLYTAQLRDWSKIIEGGGPEQRGVGHEVLSLVQRGGGRAIFSYR